MMELAVPRLELKCYFAFKLDLNLDLIDCFGRKRRWHTCGIWAKKVRGPVSPLSSEEGTFTQIFRLAGHLSPPSLDPSSDPLNSSVKLS